MIRNAPLAAVAVLALILGAAACGDETDSGRTPAAEENSQPAPPAANDMGAAADGGSEITLAADPGGDLAFDKQALVAKAGKVTLAFTNDSSVPHNVEIEAESGEEAGVTETIAAAKTTKQFDLEPGVYEYYCTIDSHKDAGMEGKLTVK